MNRQISVGGTQNHEFSSRSVLESRPTVDTEDSEVTQNLRNRIGLRVGRKIAPSELNIEYRRTIKTEEVFGLVAPDSPEYIRI